MVPQNGPFSLDRHHSCEEFDLREVMKFFQKWQIMLCAVFVMCFEVSSLLPPQGAAEEDHEDTDGMKDCDRSASSSRNGGTHKAGFATNSNQGSSMVVSPKQSQEYEMEGDIRFQGKSAF